MMFGSGMNLLSAALGFGMTAAFVAFVCARFICCRARDADDGAPSPVDFDVDFPADLERPVEDANCGLEPLVIAEIPIMKYSEALYSKDDAQCSICLGEYTEKELLRIIPTCQHNFHRTCLDLWLQKQTTCPICRVSLKELPSGKAAIAPSCSNPQVRPRTENSVNPAPDWLLPVHHSQRSTE
ncbi:putative RING-H2 finger protein ATL69 [Triticum urartu]|uniref:RING-type domain-containing protein n=1 Tax=Triticum urartu TaxID=4572 RepID=A0A8R7TL05_TRIUA|nr:putative RING-H2 finger protein ATL69 [Triticum urartu]